MKLVALILVALAVGLLPLTALAIIPGATDRLVLVAPAPLMCTSYKWEISL